MILLKYLFFSFEKKSSKSRRGSSFFIPLFLLEMGAALKINHEENPRYLHIVHSPKLRVEQKSEIPFFELDYYPFGAIMPGRNFNSSTSRFLFNGMEQDPEIDGITGADYTATNWEYDARLGRRWNLEPEAKK